MRDFCGGQLEQIANKVQQSAQLEEGLKWEQSPHYRTQRSKWLPAGYLSTYIRVFFWDTEEIAFPRPPTL